jgi:hypothetical protein
MKGMRIEVREKYEKGANEPTLKKNIHTTPLSANTIWMDVYYELEPAL